jgi:lactoylglutathione lyase
MRLKYVIKSVAEMSRAVEFHERQLGLKLKFQSPFWSEFDTGPTTLALHVATVDQPAGTVRLGFNVDDLDAFYADGAARGIEFTAEPRIERGVKMAGFIDSEGTECRISG